MINLRFLNIKNEFEYVSFENYKLMSAYAKIHKQSPTHIYNTGRKPTDPRYSAPLAPMFFERITKKTIKAAKKPVAKAVNEVTYEDIKKESAFQTDRGCCSVISMATAMNIPFTNAQTYLQRSGRHVNKGASMTQIAIAYRLSGHELTTAEDYSLEKRPTISQVCRKFSKGTFVLLIRGHILTIKNGVPQDWTKPNSRHHVIKVFTVEQRRRMNGSLCKPV